MSFCVCKILFNSVTRCRFALVIAKCSGGSLFFWTRCISQSSRMHSSDGLRSLGV